MQDNYSVTKVTFNSGAGAFVIGATAGKTLTLAGNVTQNSATEQTLSTPISMSATRTFNTASGGLTIGGAISGAGGLTKSGNHALGLGSVSGNSFGGDVAVSAGTLRNDANNQIPDGAIITVSGSGTYSVNGYSEAVETIQISSANSASASVDLGSGTLTVAPASGVSYNLASGISGIYGKILGSAGSKLIMAGTGQYRPHNKDNSFEKLEVRNGGLFQAGNYTGNNFETIFGAEPGSVLADAITLDNGRIGASFVCALHANRGITLGPGGGTIVSGLTVNGPITGTGSLTKNTSIGGGSLILNSASDYGGGTFVDAGTLLVNNTTGSGTGSGDVTVAAGATLGGSGVIAGAVTLNGTIAPGASAGTLATGAQTWNSGGTYSLEMDDASGTAGVTPGWDQLAIKGGLDVQSTAGSKFNVVLKTLGTDNLAANFNPDTAYAWAVAATTTGVSNFDPAKIALNDTAFANDLKGGVLSLAASGDGNTLNLVFTPNQSPVANAAAYGRAKDLPLKIKIADLLANYTSDPDAGDATVFEGYGSPSHGSVTTDGTWLYYTPSDNENDSFTYTVKDNRVYRSGDTPRTAQNTISIAVAPSTGLAQSISVSGGLATMQFAGIPGFQYDVQRTTDVENGPWITITGTPLTAPASGVFSFQDTAAPEGSAFYRLIQH